MSLDAATLGRLERMHHHGHAFQSRPTTGDALRPTGTNAARKAVRDRRATGGLSSQELYAALTKELADPQRPRTSDLLNKAPPPHVGAVQASQTPRGIFTEPPKPYVPHIPDPFRDTVQQHLWPRPGVIPPTIAEGAPPWPHPPTRSRHGKIKRSHRGASVPRVNSPALPVAPWLWSEMRPGAPPPPGPRTVNPSPIPTQDAIDSAAAMLRQRAALAGAREHAKGRWRPDAAGARALYQLFAELDVNGDGVLSREEFEAALAPLELDVDELATLFNSIDNTGTGRIDFRSFVASCLPIGGSRAAQSAYFSQTAPSGAGAGAKRTVAPLGKRAPMRDARLRTLRHLEEAEHAWDAIGARQETEDPELGAALDLTRRRMHKGMGDGAGLGLQALGVVPNDVHGAFKLLDTEKLGKLTTAQVGGALSIMKVKVPDAAIQRLVAHVDQDGDGCIDEKEFVALCGCSTSGKQTIYRPYRDGLAHKPTF